MPLMASARDPPPLASRNLMPITCVVQFTPTTPAPFPPVAPIVPETWVPWLWSSIGLQVIAAALNPWEPAGHVIVTPSMLTEKGAGADHTLAARSGCV